MDRLVPEDHDPQEDASYAEFRFTFFEDGSNPKEDGKPSVTLGQVESHLHHVDSGTLVDTLLVIARKFVADGMSENMFNERVPEAVRNQAAAMLATNWLINRLNSGDLINSQPVEFAVPDDASELLGD
jgi:hypothetical protein